MIIVIKLISEQNMTRRTVLCVCHVIIVIIIISIKLISNLSIILSVFGSEKKDKIILVLVTFPVMF